MSQGSSHLGGGSPTLYIMAADRPWPREVPRIHLDVLRILLFPKLNSHSHEPSCCFKYNLSGWSFIYLFNSFVCMCVFTCMYMSTDMYVHERRVSGLRWIWTYGWAVMSHSVSSGRWILVLCKGSTCSYLLRFGAIFPVQSSRALTGKSYNDFVA